MSTFPLCQVCLKNAADQEHHLSYSPEIKINICKSCHLKISKSGTGPSKSSDPYDFQNKKRRLVGRPPSTNRKGTHYTIKFPDQDFIEHLDIIASREGITRRALILKFCTEGIEKHAPGNPQTLLHSYEEGGAQTVNQLVGRIRQIFYNRGDASKKEILDLLQAGDIKGTERVAMTNRIITWLKEQGVKVTY